MTTASTSRPIVLTLCDYFLPGVNGGGPIVSVVNVATRLAAEIDFCVISRDRDAGSMRPYPAITPHEWTRVGDIRVQYLRPGLSGARQLYAALRSTPFDVLYVNSLFSPAFSIYPLFLRRAGLLGRQSVVVAPRGELSRGALEIKKSKKQSFLRAARIGRLFDDVTWQACSALEEEDIRRTIGNDARIVVAPNLPSASLSSGAGNRPAKKAGALKLLFLSRICVKKNLYHALEALRDVRGRVDFSIVGPLEDQEYCRQCTELIDTLPANIQVSFQGAVMPDQVPDLMRQHDLFVLPTQGENYGHAIVEALASGCPVLISDRTPWRDLRTRLAGWDIALENRAAFVSALQEAIDWDDRASSQFRRHAESFGRSIAEAPDALLSSRNLFRHAA